jgi:hypothetical protein
MSEEEAPLAVETETPVVADGAVIEGENANPNANGANNKGGKKPPRKREQKSIDELYDLTQPIPKVCMINE